MTQQHSLKYNSIEYFKGTLNTKLICDATQSQPIRRYLMFNVREAFTEGPSSVMPKPKDQQNVLPFAVAGF